MSKIKLLIFTFCISLTFLFSSQNKSESLPPMEYKSEIIREVEIHTPQPKILKLIELEKPVLVVPTAERPTRKKPVQKQIPVNADTEYVKKRICEVFANDCQRALIIAKHESGYKTNAISPTGDYGVMQINCYWQGYRIGMPKRTTGERCKEFLDLELNLKIAKQIYDRQGWNPWSTKKYLNN